MNNPLRPVLANTLFWPGYHSQQASLAPPKPAKSWPDFLHTFPPLRIVEVVTQYLDLRVYTVSRGINPPNRPPLKAFGQMPMTYNEKV